MISIGFASYAYYYYLTQFFNPLYSSLIVASTASMLSVLILIIFKQSKSSTIYKSKEADSIKNFIESYPRVSVLTVFIISFLFTGKKTFKYLFEILFKDFTKEEIISFVAKKI